VQADIEPFVDAVFSCLSSDFLTMPKGAGFIDYSVFEQGYEALKKASFGFKKMDPDVVFDVICQIPISFIVLRSMLGFTPPEWAYMATEITGVIVDQGYVRTQDRNYRIAPLKPLSLKDGLNKQRLTALVQTACHLLQEGAPKDTHPDKIHRLDKADTKFGLNSLMPLAEMGVPYAMLLYERFLGRPFAGHRDSISDLVGNVLEGAIENELSKHGISNRKTKRAQKIPGFDQAPDFIIPDEFSPKIVIEAKITEDDGTARDKVTRVQHLGNLSMEGAFNGVPKFEVIACIAGRGFKVRREDMKKLILATKGKVFTYHNLDKLVEYTALKEFKTTP